MTNSSPHTSLSLATDERATALVQWLHTLPADLGLLPESLAPASSDASFRRYFRVQTTTAVESLIVMDAPPAHEDCRPFIQVAELFAAAGVAVPKVIAQALEQGFLLLSDLGNTTYLNALQSAISTQNPLDYATPKIADEMYRAAFTALIHIQKASRPDVLPAYDAALLERELRLFPEWYVIRHKGHRLTEREQSNLDKVFGLLVANNLAQPQVFVHRDYHSRNLMVARHSGAAVPAEAPGVLDFQDAVYGPVTYDLVSLLRDAYIQWEEPQILDWAVRYWEQARKAGVPVGEDFGEFWRDFEWMGLQRHLKVLGIFARLYHRDGKDGYLKDLPLVMHYTRQVALRYSAFTPLLRLLDVLEQQATSVGYTF